jgi:hypothetical protein
MLMATDAGYLDTDKNGTPEIVGGSFYLSNDAGYSWSAVTLPPAQSWLAVGMSCSGANIIPAAKYPVPLAEIYLRDDYRVYGSIDAGATWTQLPGEAGTWQVFDIDMNDDGSRAALTCYQFNQFTSLPK